MGAEEHDYDYYYYDYDYYYCLIMRIIIGVLWEYVPGMDHDSWIIDSHDSLQHHSFLHPFPILNSISLFVCLMILNRLSVRLLPGY